MFTSERPRYSHYYYYYYYYYCSLLFIYSHYLLLLLKLGRHGYANVAKLSPRLTIHLYVLGIVGKVWRSQPESLKTVKQLKLV